MFRHVLLSACLICLPLFADAATVTLDGRAFTVPDGFTVEKVSSSRHILRPVNACFDDRGRLYVTDSSGSSQPPAEQAKNPQWRVVRLEDADHDGVYDKATVFADQLPMLQGILWHQGTLYVGGTPAIWKLIDKDGDGRADERVEWWNVGRPSTHCGNEVHGPYAGPDGFIYWTKGAFEPITWTNGITGRIHQDRGAHIFRARPDGSQMDSIMTGGMDNPVEVAFTSEGECIFTSTFIDFSQPGFRDGLAHAIYGGVYGKLNSNIEERSVQRTSPDVLHPFVQYGAGAPSGLCRFVGEGLGKDSQNAFFATLFNMHKVTRHQLRPAGATFSADSVDFLATDDSDFHPTDVLEDQDGSLLVVDTGGWYKLCCPTSQLWKPDVLGSLYRVRRLAVGSPAVVSGPTKSTSLPSVPAVRKGSSKGWASRVVEVEGKPFDLHAIVEAMIREVSPEELRRGLTGPAAVVKRVALVALAEREGSDLKSLEAAPFLAALDAELRRTAEWVVRRRPEWSAEITAWAKTQIPAWAKEGKLDQVRAVLPLFTRDAAGRELLSDYAGRVEDWPVPLRQAAFESMAQAGLKESLPAWSAAVERTLQAVAASDSLATNAPLQAMVVAAFRAASQLKDPPAEALRRLADDVRLSKELRLQSLAARSPRSSLSPTQFELVKTSLLPQAAPTLRFSAVRALGRSTPSTEQFSELADAVRQLGPLELNPVLAAFEGVQEATLAGRLIASLREATSLPAVRPDVIKPWLAKLTPELRKEGERVLAQALPDAAQQGGRVDSLLAEIKALKPDVRRGQALFNHAKAACVQCHRIGYAGGGVGPDLTRIGEARTERDLLEAVVSPSSSFVRSYEPVTVTTRDGEVRSGIVRDESDTQLTLVTGPGAEQRLSRADIAELKPGTLSLMPAGLDQQLSRQELADLVAFLKNTHWGAN